jgi:hypothetical protein
MAWVRGHSDRVSLCLALAVAVSAAILIDLGSHLTFITDDWELVLNRRGFGAADLLDPFHEHIVLGPTLVYKLLLATFGMSSALPFRVVAISVFLLSAVLLFVHLRPRVGDWPALLAAILILFLGAAFEDLLWPFQVGYFGSVAAGLGMLIALDRDDPKGDAAACGLLVVSLAFSSLGLAFMAGALVDLAAGHRPRAARAYVALFPLALYGVWWLGWGHAAENHLSFDNLVNTPEYAFNSAAAGITSLLGLATGDGSEPHQPHLIWGKVVLVAALALAVFRVWRGARISRDLAIVLAIALAFWILAALNRTPDRFPTSSRYQYPSAVLLLLIAGEALRGRRIPKAALVAGAVVTGAAAIGGLSLLHDQYSDRWKPYSDELRASLSGVEIARDSVHPPFMVRLVSINVSPRTYLSAVDEYGSPAYSEGDLAVRPEGDRAVADQTLASALGLRLAPEQTGRANVGCQTVRASATGNTAVTLVRGGFTVANGGNDDVEVLLSRFSGDLPVDLGPLSAGSTASLAIPIDRSTRPWRLGLRGAGPIRLCSTAPSQKPGP